MRRGHGLHVFVQLPSYGATHPLAGFKEATAHTPDDVDDVWFDLRPVMLLLLLAADHNAVVVSAAAACC
jgi:hypothetical protein